MSEEPRRRVRQRPAPRRVTDPDPGRDRKRRTTATAIGGAPERPRPRPESSSPARPSRPRRELPRAFWLALAAEATFVVILLADWLTGWGDPPAECSRAICTMGQGVGLLSLIGAVVLGLILVVAFFALAVGAAQRQPRQPRTPGTR
jgi:hypothetical protein